MPKDVIARGDVADRIVTELLNEGNRDLESIGTAIQILARAATDPIALQSAAKAAFMKAASQEAGRELRSSSDLLAWLSSVPQSTALLRLLLALPDQPASDELDAVTLLLVARFALRRTRASSSATFSDAPVERLDKFVLSHWKRLRAKHTYEWLYHPRKPQLSGLVVPRFAADLLLTSPALRQHALNGTIACDVNIDVAAGRRTKSLDFALGVPAEPLGPGDPENPLRKARLHEPLLTLEVKACMTSHRQATTRLIDELRSSLDVVKANNRRAIPVAITVVNVSPQFTNPLRLPGPNKHNRPDIDRLFKRLVERVHLDRGSGTEDAYGAHGIVVIDTDNERRIAEAARSDFVPETHTYERAIGRAAKLYEALAVGRT